MKTKSIKSKLLLLLFLSISCSFLILGFYNTQNEYNFQYDLIKQKEQDLAKQTSKYINSFIESKIAVANASIQNLKTLELDPYNKKIFTNLAYAKEAGNFAEFYFGFEESGDFIGSKGLHRTIEKTGYDPRKRGWYKAAIKKMKAGVSKPYIGKASGKLVVSIFSPLNSSPGKIT